MPRRRVAHLVLPEMPADVARPERRDVVADAPLRRRGAEARGVADDPVRHESAVASAGHVEALLVDPVRLEGVVDAGHEILVVFAAPIADAGSRELLPVRVAPARIRVEHGVAAAGEHLELVKEAVAIRRMRAAVDLEDQRPLLRGVEAAGLHEPALDHPTVRAFELDALGQRDVTGPHELPVEVGEAAQAFAELADGDVARTRRVREDTGEAPRVAREREAHDLM